MSASTLRATFNAAWRSWSNDQPVNAEQGAGCVLEMHDGNAEEALAYACSLPSKNPSTLAVITALSALVDQELFS